MFPSYCIKDLARSMTFRNRTLLPLNPLFALLLTFGTVSFLPGCGDSPADQTAAQANAPDLLIPGVQQIAPASQTALAGTDNSGVTGAGAGAGAGGPVSLQDGSIPGLGASLIRHSPGDDPGAGATKALAGQEPAAWTVMVYMDGDNNLEAMLLHDIAEMEQSLPDNVEVIIQVDRAGAQPIQGGWSGGRIYRVRRNPASIDMHRFYDMGFFGTFPPLVSELLEDLGPVNSADPASIEKFIRYAAARFPARRYAFVSMDHGGGWFGNLEDQTSKMSMTISQLTGAVGRGAAVLPRGRFDLLIYDMCLMGQMDVIFETAPVADYMIASPPPIPGYASDYVSLLPLLKDDASTRDIGRDIVDANTRFFNRHNVVADRAQFSLYDLSRTRQAVEALAALTGELVKRASGSVSALTQITARSYHFHDLGFDAYFRDHRLTSSVDLRDWLDRLDREFPDLRDRTDAVRKALDTLVVHTASTDEMLVRGGVAIYLPLVAPNVFKGYEDTAFAAKSGMLPYLRELFRQQGNASASAQAPRVEGIQVGTVIRRDGEITGIRESRILEPLSGYAVRFDVTGKDIHSVFLGQVSRTPTDQYPHYDFQQLLVDLSKSSTEGLSGDIRDILPDFEDGTNTFIREMTGQRFLIMAGGAVWPVTALHNTPDFSGIFVRALYAPPAGGAETPVLLRFSADTRQLVSITDVATGAMFMQAPGASLRFGRIRATDGGATIPSGNDVLFDYSEPVNLQNLAAGGLQLVLANLPEGSRVRYGVYANNIWGGRGSTGFTDELTVRSSPGQRELIAALKRSPGELEGRYAVGLFMDGKNGEPPELVPTFDSFTISPPERLPKTAMMKHMWRSGSGAHGYFDIVSSPDPDAPVQLIASMARDGKADMIYRSDITSYEAFLHGSGRDRILYLVSIGRGSRLALYPMESVSPRSLEGVWTSANVTWRFKDGKAELDYRDDGPVAAFRGHHEGSFTLKDNVLELDRNFPEDLRSMALILDPGTEILRLKSRKPYLMQVQKSAADGSATLARIREQLPGYWHGGTGEAATDLEVSRVTGTNYLRLVFVSGDRRSEAVASLGSSAAHLTYENGTRMILDYRMDAEGRLILRTSGTEGKDWIFTRNSTPGI